MERSLENESENDGEIGRLVSGISCGDGDAVGGDSMEDFACMAT